MGFEAVYFSPVNEMFVRCTADTQKECLVKVVKEGLKVENGVDVESTDEELLFSIRLAETHDENLEHLKYPTDPIGNAAVIVAWDRMTVPVGFIRRISV